MTQISSPASFRHFNNRLESLVPGGSFDSLGVADLPDRPSADVLITELVQRLLPRFSDRADSKEMQRCIKKLNGLYNKPNITRLFEYLRGVKSTPDPAPKEKVPASSTESDPVKTLPKITERAEKTLPYPSADRLEAILTLLENDNFKGIKCYNFILNCLYLERQLMEYIDWDCERINGILTFKKLAEKNGITPEKDNEFRFIVRLPSKPSKDSIDFALQFRTYILHTKLLETIGPALRYKGSLDRKSLKTTMVILHALLVISKTYNPSTYESISQIELLFTMARIAIYNTLSEEALCQARSSEYYLNYLGQFCNLSSIETVNAISPYARITGELLGIQTTSEHLAVYMGFLSKRYRTFGWKFQSDLYRLVNDRMNKSNDQELITSLRQNWLWNSNQRQLRDSLLPKELSFYDHVLLLKEKKESLFLNSSLDRELNIHFGRSIVSPSQPKTHDSKKDTDEKEASSVDPVEPPQQPAVVVDFPYSYPDRVTRWMGVSPLEERLDLTLFPEYGNIDSESKMRRMIYFHGFSPLVDQFYEMGIKKKWENQTTGKKDLLLMIPAELDLGSEGIVRGVIEYCISTEDQVCYHRYFHPKQEQEMFDLQHHIPQIRYEADFPSLSATAAQKRVAPSPTIEFNQPDRVIQNNTFMGYVDISDSRLGIKIRLFVSDFTTSEES